MTGCPFQGSTVWVGVGVGVGVGPGVPAVGVGAGDGVGWGCVGTGEGLDTGRLVACPWGVAAGAGATWRAVAEGVVDFVLGEEAGWPVGAAASWLSKAACGSTDTVMAFGDAAGDAAVVADVSGMEIGLSWPTRPAEDAVPSRPVLAAIAPTAAVSVRPMAPAAAIADLLGIMVTSPSCFREFRGLQSLGNVRTSVERGPQEAGTQVVKVWLRAGQPLPSASSNWGTVTPWISCKFRRATHKRLPPGKGCAQRTMAA